MALEHRLARWVKAGLIEAEQAEKIEAFEHDRGKPLFLYAVAGLGGLAIAIGLVSIVAANWDAIPGRVKLAIDLAMVAGLGLGVLRLERDGPDWAHETGLVVLYGLVMASIALVGQVYQLGGEAHSAMGVWTLLTALLMTRGRSAGLAFLWVAGLHSTYLAWCIWAADGPLDLEDLGVAAIYWGPLLTITASQSRWVQERRPRFAAIFESVGWAELVLCGSLGTFAFYEDTANEDWKLAWVGLGVSAVMTGWLWTRMARSPAGQAAQWLLATCLLLSHLPLLLSPGDLDVVAALTFIALWVFVALWAHRNGSIRTLNLATAVIGVRILIVYFEVFGSLLGTGVGLVSGGLLTLGLVWLWVRKRRDFERELSTKETG